MLVSGVMVVDSVASGYWLRREGRSMLRVVVVVTRDVDAGTWVDHWF